MTECAPKKDCSLAPRAIGQGTIKRSVEYTGVGLHTGQLVTVRFKPAAPDAGVYFQRIDLPTQPLIPATLEAVCDTLRCTVLGKEGAIVGTVEHLLAATFSLGITNLCIEITGEEVPIADGSSAAYLALLQEAGFCPQEGSVPVVQVTEPLYYTEGGTTLVAMPCDQFKVSYLIHYPSVSGIGTQYQTVVIDQKTFTERLAFCRTFCSYAEVDKLQKLGLIQGASLETGVVIDNDRVLNPDGLRDPNEMVLHKILDLIGDFALMGKPVQAHILAVCGGHRAHVAMARVINDFKMENL